MISQVTKTVADKLLKDLGEKKFIGMSSTNKDAKGSQFVFWTLQVRSPSPPILTSNIPQQTISVTALP